VDHNNKAFRNHIWERRKEAVYILRAKSQSWQDKKRKPFMNRPLVTRYILCTYLASVSILRKLLPESGESTLQSHRQLWRRYITSVIFGAHLRSPGKHYLEHLTLYVKPQAALAALTGPKMWGPHPWAAGASPFLWQQPYGSFLTIFDYRHSMLWQQDSGTGNNKSNTCTCCGWCSAPHVYVVLPRDGTQQWRKNKKRARG